MEIGFFFKNWGIRPSQIFDPVNWGQMNIESESHSDSQIFGLGAPINFRNILWKYLQINIFQTLNTIFLY